MTLCRKIENEKMFREIYFCCCQFTNIALCQIVFWRKISTSFLVALTRAKSHKSRGRFVVAMCHIIFWQVTGVCQNHHHFYNFTFVPKYLANMTLGLLFILVYNHAYWYLPNFVSDELNTELNAKLFAELSLN